MADNFDIGGLKIVEDHDGVQLFKSNRDTFEDEVLRVNCSQYQQCPICYKCMCKAGHQYIQCEECQVPLCHHNADNRYKMIRPKNFTIEAKGVLADSLRSDIKTYNESKEDNHD